ncbi:hypothetical protein BACCAP_01897 [Pseudoflavonifractor capillosus ATCC 29799]|uniref:Uncharacterized protein n=1 Tax=Pseudoflavonifractor capillosus ATCC 29799 TaxID=411467 RepID=A6NUL5_9FIRM|nr:hypothetical protein BACCAP_01897 [Pseudoflavonifractor capillosus ATCC 29799]
MVVESNLQPEGEGKPGHPAVGPVWNLLLTEKRLKEASTWMW